MAEGELAAAVEALAKDAAQTGRSIAKKVAATVRDTADRAETSGADHLANDAKAADRIKAAGRSPSARGGSKSGAPGQPPKVRVTGPDPNIEPVEITVRPNPAPAKRKINVNKFEFRKKMGKLVALGEQGKLFKATNPVERDREVTKGFRQSMIDRIYAQYHEVNPDFAAKLIHRVTKIMQPDHTWELQLGGPDAGLNLGWLDGEVNEWIGMREIRPQLAKLPDGTPIRIRVVE